MGSSTPAATRYLRAREQLLASGSMEEQLSFVDVMRTGKLLYNRWNSLRLYGMRPIEWYLRGVRILGRTSIEAHPDRPADEIGAVTARVLGERRHKIVDVVDPFLGSGNLTYHLARYLHPERIVGYENNAAICAYTAKSFSLLKHRGVLGVAEIVTRNADWTDAQRDVRNVPTLVVVAPPWGAAYSGEGLDLRKTAPPVPTIISQFLNGPATELLFLVPIAGGKTLIDSAAGDCRLELITHHPRKASGFLLLRRKQ